MAGVWFYMAISCIDNASGFLEVLFSFTAAPLSLGQSQRGSRDSWLQQEFMPSSTSLSGIAWLDPAATGATLCL